MNYRHLTAEELVRQIGAQVGNDLELEGELVRRVVAGEVQVTEQTALNEKDEEIDDLKIEIANIKGELDALEDENNELEASLASRDKTIEEAVTALTSDAEREKIPA